jgi:hypothetical protein
MQPYFLPYLGYWQLLNYVDRFVIYDDVNYITRGWVNRNRILINGEPRYLTIPLCNASQNRLICEIGVAPSVWRSKLLRSIELAYMKSPFFNEVIPLLNKIIQRDDGNLASFVTYQISTLAEFIGIDTELRTSSRRYSNSELAGQARIIDICKRESADIYVNAEGGRLLYDSNAFAEAGLKLQFIKTNMKSYAQRSSATFVPNLSIVDTLMAVGREGVREMLADFSLIG